MNDRLRIISESPSLASQFLLELRDTRIQQDRLRFRRNLERLGEIMAYEISKNLEYDSQVIQTPLEKTDQVSLADPPVLITILRAGLPFFTGFLNFYDQSPAGFLGAARQEGSQEISVSLEYQAMPDVTDKVVIVADPMLATGKSLAGVLRYILSRGNPSAIHTASIIASPEGIELIQNEFKNLCYIWSVAMDRGLDANAFIIPGLGDAGDLSFGIKH